MLYLPDANVLIRANATYYPIDQVPEFWEWLLDKGEKLQAKIPLEVMEEVKAGREDPLLSWLREAENEQTLMLQEEVDSRTVQAVVSKGYAPDLTDDELEQLGRDPFLIAYAMARRDRCVVTVEVSKPKRLRHNRKIPDVCDILKIPWCDPFAFHRALGFKTTWRN